MRTTETILTALRQRAEEDVRQQIIAHENLARLRAELAAHAGDPQRAAGLRTQIGSWRRMVDEDVDDSPAQAPAVEDQVKPRTATRAP